MIGTLNSVFYDHIKRVVSIAKAETIITEDNVFQEGDKNVLAVLDEMVEYLLLPGSCLLGLENLEELLAKAES